MQCTVDYCLSAKFTSYNSIVIVILYFSCLLADRGEEVLAQNLSNGNVWKERMEFYHSAQPKNEEEEDLMMRRALQESQKLEEERQRQILEETASRVQLLCVFLFFILNMYIFCLCCSVLIIMKSSQVKSSSL